MLFSSYIFLFVFLPVTLTGFCLLARFLGPKPAKLWLTLASLFFYGWWNPIYVVLIVLSMLFNYWLGRRIGQAVRAGGAGGVLLFWGVTANLVLLGYYKYANFFVTNANAVFGTHWVIGKIVLPLGISFFTFTQIAYLVDARRGVVCEYDLADFLLFITFFPHLIAGPIIHHSEMMPQFAEPKTYRFDWNNLAIGLGLFAMGLFKKVVIADALSGHAATVFEAAAAGNRLWVADAWAGVLSYTFQIYFDFSGYSDMAIGLARMLNVSFPENFDSPYKAQSPIEFWRRWHITLSFFLRDYLYIPLGGNRRGRLRQHLNLFVTMLLGGLWHGADWTFVMWGAFHGVALSANHLWRDRRSSMPPALAWMLTFLFVTLAWVLFRAHSIDRVAAIFAGMAGLNGFGWAGGSVGPPELRECAAGLLLVLCCPNRQMIMSWQWRSDYLYAAAFAVLAGISLLQMSNPPPFIYFQF